MGMPRRYFSYSLEIAWLHKLVIIGILLTLFGWLTFIYLIWESKYLGMIGWDIDGMDWISGSNLHTWLFSPSLQ
jgi:hypothetical protein